MAGLKIYKMAFSSVYPHYITKAEKKDRTKEDVDEVIRWLEGYAHTQRETHLENRTDVKTLSDEAPKLNPDRNLIQGVICGVRVEEIEEPLMQEIRYMDKMIDELAKGKKMEKILRES